MVAALIFIVLYSMIFFKVYSMHRRMSQWKTSSGVCPASVVRAKTDLEEDHLTFATVEEHQNHSVHSPSHVNGAYPSLIDTNGKIYEEENLVSVRSPKKQPAKKKKKRLPHLRTALTLCLVTLTFVIAYSPFIAVYFINVSLRASGDQSTNHTGPEYVRNSANYFFWHFYFFNHITNPIIYSFMNPRFKEALKSVFLRKKNPRS